MLKRWYKMRKKQLRKAYIAQIKMMEMLDKCSTDMFIKDEKKENIEEKHNI